jgi:hypothetical protein
MHKHGWKRWATIAFYAALLGGGVSINLYSDPAWALKSKEDDYHNFRGEHPVKLDDFLEAMDRVTTGINSLLDKISKEPCTSKKKYDGYLLSLNNAIVALKELEHEVYVMGTATEEDNGQHTGGFYISAQQYGSYSHSVFVLRTKVEEARDSLKQRDCERHGHSMYSPPKSAESDDDWPDPSGHANVVHGSTEPYPQRGKEGPGGRPYNWPGGKAYPGNDGPVDEPNSGPSDKPDDGPSGGAYPGPGGGAYPVPGGGAYPGPGGM